MSITSLSSEISRLTRDIADLQKKRGDIARKRSDVMAKVDRAQRAMASAKDLRKAADQAKVLSGLQNELSRIDGTDADLMRTTSRTPLGRRRILQVFSRCPSLPYDPRPSRHCKPAYHMTFFTLPDEHEGAVGLYRSVVLPWNHVFAVFVIALIAARRDTSDRSGELEWAQRYLVPRWNRYAANLGTVPPINRRNRVLQAPATIDSCDFVEGDPRGSPFAFCVPFRSSRLLRFPATKIVSEIKGRTQVWPFFCPLALFSSSAVAAPPRAKRGAMRRARGLRPCRAGGRA